MTLNSITLLCFSCISAVALAQPCAPAPKNLSAWFTFDEPMFRAANHVPGMVGQALRFDGKTEFFEIPAATPGLNGGEENFSVELWVKTTNSKSIRNIVDKRDMDARGWLIYIRSGNAGFQILNGPEITDSIATSINIADGRWHHIVGVAKRLPPQAPMVFVDGQLRAQAGRNITLGSIDNHAPVWIARHHANPYVKRDNIFFDGDVDELSFYRRALTPAEIAALYKAGRAGKCRK